MLVVRHPAVAGEVEEFRLGWPLRGGSGRGEAECSENGVEAAAFDEAHGNALLIV